MKMNGMSRRKFITSASVGIAGIYTGLHTRLVQAMMGSGGMGGAVAIVDPPPGTSFFEIPTAAKNSAGVYELLVKEAKLRLNGTPVTLLTYNGMYPGPAIRAAWGDMLKIKLTNGLPKTTVTNVLGHRRNITNIHTHGLHVSPSGMADNMMMMASPGEVLNYEYDLSLEEPGHLNFYHPHVHGTVAEQYWGGLAGPLIIEDKEGRGGGPLGSYETHVMIIKDITISNGLPEPYTATSQFMRGKEGNLVMVNGQVNPVLSIRPGQVQRWQIVNACNARFLKLSLDRHSLWLVGTDGGLLDKPYQLSTILLSPGERIDVLVKADQGGGDFKLLSLPYARSGNSSLQQVTLLTLAYGGISAGDSLPLTVNPAAARLNMNVSLLPHRQITLSMMMGKGYINGISYVSMDSAYKIMSKTGTYEVWEIYNQSGMDHPFHQHVNSCQVLSVSGGDRDYASLYTSTPAWKDVVLVPKMGSVTMLVPVMDYDGMSMFHCHIVEHEDIGMMGVWEIMTM